MSFVRPPRSTRGWLPASMCTNFRGEIREKIARSLSTNLQSGKVSLALQLHLLLRKCKSIRSKQAPQIRQALNVDSGRSRIRGNQYKLITIWSIVQYSLIIIILGQLLCSLFYYVDFKIRTLML